MVEGHSTSGSRLGRLRVPRGSSLSPLVGSMRPRLLKGLPLAAAVVLVSLTASVSPAAAVTAVSCPFNGLAAGDNITRGFYVSNYPGTDLNQATVRYIAPAPGDYMITLTAHSGAYDGPVIGSPTVAPSLPAGGTLVTFPFAAAPVAQGSTIAFIQTATGPGNLGYDTGVGPCPGVTQTEDVLPPLDNFRRDSVGLTITDSRSPPSPSNAFTLGAVARNKKKGTATLNLILPNPGELTASGNGVSAASAGRAVISKAVGVGPAQLLIKATGKKKRKLNETGKVKLNVVVTYTPTGGDPNTQSVMVKLKRKL
jgi:hypothetical protein